MHKTLFGKDEVHDQITLGEMKKIFEEELKCSPQTSINFARFLFEQASPNIGDNYKKQTGDFVEVRLDHKLTFFKILEQIEPEFTMSNKIEYFKEEKEDKMKLIIGQQFL